LFPRQPDWQKVYSERLLPMERNLFSAQNQTLRSYRVYIFHIQSRHHHLLFK